MNIVTSEKERGDKNVYCVSDTLHEVVVQFLHGEIVANYFIEIVPIENLFESDCGSSTKYRLKFFQKLDQ